MVQDFYQYLQMRKVILTALQFPINLHQKDTRKVEWGQFILLWRLIRMQTSNGVYAMLLVPNTDVKMMWRWNLRMRYERCFNVIRRIFLSQWASFIFRLIIATKNGLIEKTCIEFGHGLLQIGYWLLFEQTSLLRMNPFLGNQDLP